MSPRIVDRSPNRSQSRHAALGGNGPQGAGQLHAVLGDEEAAHNDFDAAIAIFEELGSRLELARTLVLRGDDENLIRARELFQACGATGDLENL